MYVLESSVNTSTPPVQENSGRIPRNRLLSHAVGLAGQNMTYNFVSNRLFVFLNTVLGIPPEKTGWLTSISTTWDAVNDPIVGTFIDSRKFKPGHKLRPYLLTMPPIIAVAVALMFCDFGLTQNATIVTIICLYLVYDLFYSFQDTALWGIVSLSSPHSEERARVSQWASIGAGAGAVIGGLFPTIRQILVDNVGVSEKTAYMLGGIVFGVGGMLIAMLAYRMKEQVAYQPEKRKTVIENLSALRYNKTLIIICLARLFSYISLQLPWEYFFETSGVSYKIFGMELSGGTMQVVFTMLPGIPGALAMFFATKIIDRMGGMKNLLVTSEIAQSTLRIVCFAIGANNRFLNTGVILTVMLLSSFFNLFTSMKDIAHRSLISDSIDEVELKTGERTEGIAFSMQNFISKLGSAISKLIQGYMLKALGFTNKGNLSGSQLIASQTGRFLKYRWHQFMLGPVIGSVLYLVTILFLKEDKEKTAEVERQLKEKRKAAEEAAQVKAE